jgi:hypothetical protein
VPDAGEEHDPFPMATTKLAIAPEIRKLSQRLERWRSQHPSRSPLPASVWTAAVELARKHGVWRVGKALRLDYSKLKQLTESADPGRSDKQPTFVELLPSPASSPAECLIEVEANRAKIRIQWKAATASDLSGFVRELLEQS